MKNIFFTFILFVIYLIFYILIRHYQPSEIIFYQGLELIILLIPLFYIILYYTLKNNESSLNICFTFFLLAYSFHITVPSLLDRSISLYILGLSNVQSYTSMESYKSAFYNGFIIKNEAIEKRVNEQINSGNLFCKLDQCILTPRGKVVHSINSTLVKIFNVDPRYVNPDY